MNIIIYLSNFIIQLINKQTQPKMKKVLSLVAVAGMFTFVACGPSAAEKEAEAAAAAQIVTDSLAAVEAAAAEEAAAAATDSTATEGEAAEGEAAEAEGEHAEGEHTEGGH